MRIEQYFLMTDYSLWEIILNGYSPIPTRVVEGTTTQNLAFVSSSNTDSTTESLSAAASVFAVCAKMLMSSLPNVDSLSNATGRNLGANGPTSMGFDMSKVEWSVITATGRDILYESVGFPRILEGIVLLSHREGLKGHFARECRSLKDSRRNCAAEPQMRTVPMRSLPIMLLWLSHLRALLLIMRFSSKSLDQIHDRLQKLVSQLEIHESDESWPPCSLYDRFQPSDGYHAVSPSYTWTFMPPKPDLVFNTASTTVETDHHAFNVQLSPAKPEQDLSHTTRPTTPIIKDWVKSPRHSVQHVETSIPAATPKLASPKSASSGKRRNRKACFVCKSVDHLIKDCDLSCEANNSTHNKNHAHRGNHKQYAQMTHHNSYKHMVPTAVLTQSKPVSITAVRPVSAVVPQIKVTRPKQVQLVVTKSKSPIKRHITHSPSPKTSNLPPRVTAVKALVLSPTKPEQYLSHTNRPTTPIIEDWVSDSEDESETKALQIVSSFVQSSKQVKYPRHSVQHVETSIPVATPKPASPKSASSGKRRNRKACFVCKSVDHLIKECNYHAKKMAQPTTKNHVHRGNHKHYALMTHHNPQKHMVPTAVFTQSKPVSITVVRPVSAAVTHIKELKFNLFSVSQMYDKKNSVLFIDTKWSDDSFPPSPIYDRYQSGTGYHIVPPPYTGTFMPPKLDLKMAQPTARNHAHRGHHKQYAPLTCQYPQRYVVPAVVVTQSKPVPLTAARPVSTDVPKIE
nr:hypothetical protein [Tanacetum cinerariifolium]